MRTAAVQRIFPGAPMIIPSGGAVAGLRNGTVNPTAQSSNWAGYAVTGRNGAFGSVSASWTEPTVNCAMVQGRRLASFWVGLDGVPPSFSVEQLGTDADCNGTNPHYFAWWEMFPRPAVNLTVPVRPGDHLSASVTFRGAGRFALFIKDSTQHWSRTIFKSHAGLDRSSAEVIAEAPALLINGNIVIQNLANFGSVHWAGSTVNGTPLKNIGRRIRITMVEVNGPRIRATTSLISAADAFTNRWVRAS